MRKLISALQILILLGCASKELSQDKPAVTVPEFKSCAEDSEKQLIRSNELQEIVRANQEDRKIPGSQIDWNRVSAADEIRAKRVAEIFAEGCFKTANDYSAAALVFQHGVVPDHYYQAYLWAGKALKLGDDTQKLMIANSIDRYLNSLGFKQLFGAQTFRNGPKGCRCLGPVETKFSEKQRMKISGISLARQISLLRESNRENPNCEKVLYCEKELKSPPQGLFPGIW